MLNEASNPKRKKSVTLELFTIGNKMNLLMRLPVSKQLLILTVDTGAETSLLRPHKLNKKTQVDTGRSSAFIGLGRDNPVRSIGTISTDFRINDLIFPIEFHLMDCQLCPGSDGILGNDFLIRYRSIMDFNRNTITFSIKDPHKSLEEGEHSNKKLYNKHNKEENAHNRISIADPARERNDSSHSDIYCIQKPRHPINIKNTDERVEYLLHNVNIGCQNESLKNDLIDLIREFNDIFYVEGDKVTFTNAAQHEITLKPGTKPIFIKQYRVPQSLIPEMNKQIDELLENDIIEPSNSNWNSPILLVPKKEGPDGKKQHRLVVDFRRINEVTESEAYPMPDWEEEISKMHGSKYFSTLDLHSAFHQILLDENSRILTSFQTSKRKFQFKRMPFGLKGSPITWQRTINSVLGSLLENKIMSYMDDIITYAETADEHMDNLRAIFAILRTNNLKLKVEKSSFICSEVKYLGHVIDCNGTRSDPKKVECINNFPKPTSLIEVQRFLGMANYYRKYVLNYAKIARPMHDLCKKEMPFVWSQACEEAFQAIKLKLMGNQILIFPNFKETFYLTTDASDYAVGAVLSQGTIPGDRPIQFFSKSLTGAQLNYATIHKELLAIIMAIEEFAHYLFGRQFVVITDHKPLTALFNQKRVTSRLLRWKILLSEYDFKIIHMPGRLNFVADCLSRIGAPAGEHDVTPKSVSDFKPNNTEDILVVTRNQSKRKNSAQNEEQTASIPEIREENNLRISERRGTLLTQKQFDKVYYFFNRLNTTLQSKLESRLKVKFEIPNKENKLYQFSMYQAAAWTSPNFKTTEAKSALRELLQSICNQCVKNNHKTIAISVNLKDASDYFELKRLIRQIFKDNDMTISIYQNKIVEVTEIEDIAEILSAYHNSLLGGHTGTGRMRSSIKRFYNWPSLFQDVEAYVKACPICEKTKVTRHTRSPMQIRSTASEPFQKIYIDFVGEINPPSAKGHKYIFTAICDLTKFVIAVPTYDCTAESAARAFVKHIILKHNIPEEVISDNGSAFLAELFNEIMKLFKIKKVFTTPYWPQANAVERYHRSLAQYMRAFTESEPDNWHKLLHYASFSYNNAVNSATGHSPHSLVYGFDVKIPVKITADTPSYNYDSFKYELQIQLRNTQRLAKEAIEKRKEKNKENYDRNTRPLVLKEDDLVLKKNETKLRKFDNPYSGPFRVTKVISPSVVIIKTGRRSMKIHTDKLIKAQANHIIPSA